MSELYFPLQESRSGEIWRDARDNNPSYLDTKASCYLDIDTTKKTDVEDHRRCESEKRQRTHLGCFVCAD